MSDELQGQDQLDLEPWPPTSMDPNQMFVLSGPYPSPKHKCGVMIARAIPPGSTVIAKPVIPGQPSTCSGHTNLPLSIPSQFLPNNNNANHGAPPTNTLAPKAMIWNFQYPEGQLVPLRQPEPAVYFFPQQKAIH